MRQEIKQTHWHTKSFEAVAKELDTDINQGLSDNEVEKRMDLYGENALEEKARKSPALIFLDQFNDFTIWVLIAAAFISGVLLRETIDAITIAAILVINAALGFVQEYRAEKALDALKKLAAPHSNAIRNGSELEIRSSEIVPGDIILLEGGDVVPADARLVSSHALSVDESSLTGESVASLKTVDPIDNPDIPPADRDNMVFLGTTISVGRAKAIVTETGPRTEMGKIAELIQVEEEKTPLQVDLHRIGRTIAFIVVGVAASVFIVGLIRGFSLVFMFLSAVSLAVAAIPEGLPAIVTATLAIGVQAMAAQNAIVRRLHAVETLGSTTFICTDKTGTLTLNKMTAEKVYLDGHVFDVVGKRIAEEQAEYDRSDLAQLAAIATLANDARYIPGNDLPIGDPTETALLDFTDLLGFHKTELESQNQRVAELPFDSERKRMTTINRVGDNLLALIKGAPEIVVDRCLHELAAHTERSLSEERKSQILAVNDRLAAEGYRNLAFAYKRIESLPGDIPGEATTIEQELIFAGLIALTDPPRPEVPTALETANKAGVKVVMITGDNSITAAAIADRIGLLGSRQTLTGIELETITEDELARRIYDIGVFARVDPSHKVKIVNALKQRGEIVAMTGDGVNDAPAIKRADIGISMGQVGTEVTKEASDIILTDDNFATIIRAVRQGRLVFDNLKKFILFLLSCNTSEVLTVFIALMIGLPVPLLPAQILWTNLITDGLPALALGVEPAEKNLMDRPPRDIREGVLARPRLIRVVWQGALMTTGILTAFILSLVFTGTPLFGDESLESEAGLSTARTVAFTAMVLIQLIHSFNYRTATNTIFSSEAIRNKFLLVAVAASFGLQLAVVYIPFLQTFFNTTPLSAAHWGIILASIIPVLLLVDFTKKRFPIGRF